MFITKFTVNTITGSKIDLEARHNGDWLDAICNKVSEEFDTYIAKANSDGHTAALVTHIQVHHPRFATWKWEEFKISVSDIKTRKLRTNGKEASAC